MNRKEMSRQDLSDLLGVRLRVLREASEELRSRAAEIAWPMLQRDVPWALVLASLRREFPGDESGVRWDREPGREADAVLETYVDPRDLARTAPPPLRREAGRYERERLSASTRNSIRMARQARRWHEIRKMRNILLGIDQAHLKRMLGAESEVLNQEINALLRSWAPLVRERQQGGRPTRRRR